MKRHLLTRRKAMKGIALLGSGALSSAFMRSRPALAADLMVGFIFVGPREDWGWNQSHVEAADALAALPGVGIVEAGYLPESTDYADGKDNPQTEAYADEMERLISVSGARMVFSTSVGSDPFLNAVATKHPDVTFHHATILADGTSPTNVSSQNALINQGHYVNGVAAGLCTRTNKLGFVAGEAFGTVLLNVNSFLLGSRVTNPDATVQVVFTQGWEDETREAAATNALVDAGCDVIACHLDSPKTVIETAESRGVRTCGHAVDQGPLAPEGFVTGAEFHWTGMFKTFVEATRTERAKPLGFVTGGYDKGYVRSSPFGAGANPAAINAAEAAIRAMKKSQPIFVGPITDNTGKQVVPAGTTYGPYASELQDTDYLVAGVIGSIPSAD